jgi:hypothetical protein
MRASCTKCGYQFESVDIGQERAFKEIEEKSTRHVKQKHGETVSLLSKATMECVVSMARLLHFNEFVIVPEEENFILEQLSEAQDTVMMAIGFDPEEGEEEEEDDTFPQIEVVPDDPIGIETEPADVGTVEPEG